MASSLECIKKRPELTGKPGGILKTKFEDRGMNVETYTPAQLFLFIGDFFTGTARNYTRKQMLQVLYQTLYLYMDKHNVIMTKHGAHEICKVIKQWAPAFKDRQNLFMRKDDPRCIVAYKF